MIVFGSKATTSAKMPSRDAAAAIETEVCRGKAREAADRFLERYEPFVAHVPPEQSRERAVGARVRVRFEEHAFWRGCRLIRSEAHPLDRDLPTHVLLRSDEVARAHAALVFDDEIHRGQLRRCAAHLRDIRQRLPGEWLQRLILEGNEKDTLGASRGQVEILPVRTRRAHLALDALARGGIPKPGEPCVKA